MDDGFWEELERLFHLLVDRSSEERKRFYRKEEVPEALQAELEELIAVDGASESNRRTAVSEAILQASGDFGEIDGKFEILEELGSGGQGTVFLARRAGDQLQGQVAIKVLHGRLEGDAQQRFLQECHILSGFDHPNIARFLDTGTTSNGNPYLVMEAVRGQPILEYCEARGLSLDARLELFCRVAGAVQAAHRQLIIHRDLKNSNILVTEDGEPKLLDFGIAKLLDSEESLAKTQTGRHHLTPEAASPEQVMGETLTTSTDIYSLGLLLYRLLTGQPAYQFERNTPIEVGRVVCTTEPDLPSATSGRPELRGDLDAIILQALEKKPDQRYSSVEALVEDIRRYRRQEPVRARAAGWGYRASKFLKRHRKPLITVAAAVMVSAIFFLQIRSERDRALAMQMVLLGIFETADLELGVEAIIDQATFYLDRLEDQPEVRAQLMTTLGWIYRALGRYDEAMGIMDQALDLRRELYGQSHLEIADTLYRIGVLKLETQDFPSAEESLRQARSMSSELRGENDWSVVNSRSKLAEVEYELGRFDTALEGAEAVMEAQSRLLVGQPPTVRQAMDVSSNLNLLAGCFYQKKRYPEAETILSQALTLLTATVGPDRLGVADLWNSLAMVQRKQERLKEAAASMEEAARIERELLGEKSIRLGIRLLNLGNIYRRQDKVEQAVISCEQALGMTIELGGENHPNVSRIESCLEKARGARGAPSPRVQ